MTNSNEKLSLSEKKIIHNVEIKKMPCGKYFEALQTLKNLPEDFIEALAEGKEDFKLSEMMSIEGITELVMRLLVILPDFTFAFLSTLMDIEINKMKNELTPIELIDIIKEFWKINKLESFFVQMKSILSKAMTIIGFKELLQFASKSE